MAVIIVVTCCLHENTICYDMRIRTKQQKTLRRTQCQVLYTFSGNTVLCLSGRTCIHPAIVNC